MDLASIEAVDFASLVATLAEFGCADARVAQACFSSLVCRVADEVAAQGSASWLVARGVGLPFVRAVTGAMCAHRETDEMVSTGAMLLTPLIIDGNPSHIALLMGLQAIVATVLPRLPLSGSDAYGKIMPSVMLLLGCIAERAPVLLDVGAVGLFEKLRISPHVPREMRIKAEVAVEIIRDGDIAEMLDDLDDDDESDDESDDNTQILGEASPPESDDESDEAEEEGSLVRVSAPEPVPAPEPVDGAELAGAVESLGSGMTRSPCCSASSAVLRSQSS